jgi:hypothetical protein
MVISGGEGLNEAARGAGVTHLAAPDRIAFLAISQAHQFLHWIPAALRLAREPNVEVTVLCSTRAGMEFIRSYDPEGQLRLKRLWAPSWEAQGLFTPPKRRLTLLLNYATIASFPTLVTTEPTSSFLYQVPGFRSRIVNIRHGAGDREGGYNPKQRHFDLTVANGPKDKERLIARGIVTEENCVIGGYPKFELAKREIDPDFFERPAPMALYNAHFHPELGSWVRHGAAIVRQLEQIQGWNFVVAPHVKLRGGPYVRSASPNVLIDRGSIRSIDMSYTESADVYIGDISSQVYEFLRRPRPCVFLNLDRIAWRENENYAHWHLGQVVEDLQELEAALDRAGELQPMFEDAQRKMTARSVDPSPEPASERQARAILSLVQKPR